MVVYFDVPDVPGKYFSCSRYGTMTAGACAKNFTSAPHAAQTGRLQGCVACSIGALHAAGQAASGAIKLRPVPAPLIYRSVCLRCRRSGCELNSRLIGRMRLVRDHTICVSCYNREREVLHGANAKGALPKKWSRLFVPVAVYMENGRVTRDQMLVPVLDRIEAVMTVLRSHKSDVAMWASPAIVRAKPGAALC